MILLIGTFLMHLYKISFLKSYENEKIAHSIDNMINLFFNIYLEIFNMGE